MLNYVMNILHEYPVTDLLRYKIQGYGNIDKNIVYIDATVTNLIESAT